MARPRKEGWEPRYLRVYATTGNPSKAAEAAGVSTRLVMQRKVENPDFADQTDAAREAFLDSLEERLGYMAAEKHNVIACIARLKADRAWRYSEKLMTVTVSPHDVLPPDDAKRLLIQLVSGDRPLSLTDLPRLSLPAAVEDADTSVSSNSDVKEGD